VEAERSAREVAEALVTAVAEPMRVESRVLHATMSVGIALSQAGGSSPAELFRDADAAMYRAKSRGRGSVDVFDELLGSQIVRRLEVEHQLRLGLERGELVPYFQPIVDLLTEEMVGAEALVRWHHPQRVGDAAPALRGTRAERPRSSGACAWGRGGGPGCRPPLRGRR
jgi:predicted signal transduction protein with EAL and GGDEF domain